MIIKYFRRKTRSLERGAAIIVPLSEAWATDISVSKLLVTVSWPAILKAARYISK